MKKLIVFLGLVLLSCNNDSIGKRVQIIKTQRIENIRYDDIFNQGLLKLEQLANEQPAKYSQLLSNALRVKNSTIILESLLNKVSDKIKEEGIVISDFKSLSGTKARSAITPKVLVVMKQSIDNIYTDDLKHFKDYSEIKNYIKENFNFKNIKDANGNRVDYYSNFKNMNSIEILSDIEYLKYNCAKYKHVAISSFINLKKKKY